MKVYVVETSPAAPYQFSGITEYGEFVYIKHRGKQLKVMASPALGSTPETLLALIIDSIPDFAELSNILEKHLDWELVHLGVGWDKHWYDNDPIVIVSGKESGKFSPTIVDTPFEAAQVKSYYPDAVTFRRSELIKILSYVNKEY